MFDLKKDVDKYKGVPPYASELYGIHQSLLGWRSQLTKDWLARSGYFADPRVIQILNGRIVPGPTQAFWSDRVVSPLSPGSPKSPFSVSLTRDWNSELMRLVRDEVQTFVEQSGGSLPQGRQWQKIIDALRFNDWENTALRTVQKRVAERLSPPQVPSLQSVGNSLAELAAAQTQFALAQAQFNTVQVRFLQIMQYESQIADFLIEFAQGKNNHDPDALSKLFVVLSAAPLEELLRPADPLAQIDPKDTHAALSPIGFVHIFRQYFFDLGSFLGEPVEHIWLAPGTTIELVETSSRRVLTERSLEELMETTLHTEHDVNVKDELSEAIKSENENDTKLAVSVKESVSYPVFQGEATQNFSAESSRKDARETTHKNTRETTEKVATDLKRSYKTTFKTVTESIDTRSRRHVIQNTTPDLLNYELRRKMRRVGVQLQDLGTRLCWQVYVDDPGNSMGLAELVDVVGSPDLSSLKNPDHVPYLPLITSKVTVPFTFKPKTQAASNGAMYEWSGTDSGREVANHAETSNKDEQDEQIYIDQAVTFVLPQAGYKCNGSVRLMNVGGGAVAILRGKGFVQVNDSNAFNIVLQRVRFTNGADILLDLEVDFVPVDPDGEQKRVKAMNDEMDKKYDADKARLLRRAYLDAIRARIKSVGDVKCRPSWDLREEERTVIYRNLIDKLMLGVWDTHDGDTQRVAHLRSEVIRSIFDVDSLLYFVAPEWWKPRERSELSTTVDLSGVDTNNAAGASLVPSEVPPEDRVSWNDGHFPNRSGNYKITEDSAPARLGSSLGWLMQIDGDNLRNAFLNAPWVKAVLPVRPGREEAALNWLRETVEGKEGLDEPYSGTDSDPELMGKTLGKALEIIANRMARTNSDFGQTLAADKVFENGFDPLDKSFDAGLPACEIFSQWISVVPTDQIVAIKYEPTELFE